MNLLQHALMLLLDSPLEMLISFSCFVITVSCILLINHMKPGVKHFIEKCMVSWIAFGAFGGMVGPFFGFFIDPTWAEVMLYTGCAVFSMWLTWPYWHELPVLDRRRVPGGTDEDVDFDRRTA